MDPSDRKPSVSRRDFIRMVASISTLTTVSTFLDACSKISLSTPTEAPVENMDQAASSPPVEEPTLTVTPDQGEPLEPTFTPTSTPEETEELVTSKVAFIKTGDRSEGVRKAIDLLGINPVEGKNVFLKPNFNSADAPPGSTHPDVLRSLVLKLKEMGARKISVGDRSGMGLTRRVMQKLGVFELAEELDFDVIDFDELEADDWVTITPPDSHWKQGFPLARPCLQAEALVSTCCLKTHQYGGHFTMSLKNSVGMVASLVPGGDHNYMDELHGSARQRSMIASINTAYSPSLIVLDGVEAFTTGGPATGRRATPEVMLAGTDRIAIDAVGVAILRYFGTTKQVSQGPIFRQEQISRAVELGLGVDSPDNIEFITEDSDSAAFAEEIQQILLSE